MITSDSSYKIMNIIHDTWPQIFISTNRVGIVTH